MTKKIITSPFGLNRAWVILWVWGLVLHYSQVQAQTPPWQKPLQITWSSDGATFGAINTFQDSAGVPSLIRWKGDTLVCAFQWFRQPQGAPTWDKIAVKFSYDNGSTWTTPTPISITGIPAGYLRPFDPALTTFAGDSIRLYFSSSDGMPQGGLDSTVNTYSAKSADGVHYTFEPGARVDVTNKAVIDPSVIYFLTGWHYAAPAGAPQDGARHYVSPDGLNFSAAPIIGSDASHNWTGNFMINNSNELRFYGHHQEQSIWYNSSANGGVWNGYVNTNVQGGDVSVLQVAPNSYCMIYVGLPYNATGLTPAATAIAPIHPFPNPATVSLSLNGGITEPYTYQIIDVQGRWVTSGNTDVNYIPIHTLPSGSYILEVTIKQERGRWIFNKL